MDRHAALHVAFGSLCSLLWHLACAPTQQRIARTEHKARQDEREGERERERGCHQSVLSTRHARGAHIYTRQGDDADCRRAPAASKRRAMEELRVLLTKSRGDSPSSFLVSMSALS